MGCAKKAIEHYQKLESEWYNLRPALGAFNWAMMACLLGGREAGKSYAVTNYFVDSFCNDGVPFTWLRLTDKQANALLNNNAEKLVDPDIRRQYGLDLVTRGSNVYHVERRTYTDKNGNEKTEIVKKTLMARVFALSNFYNQKGNGLFDKDFLNDLNMQYHIALDEFEKEEGEKDQGDILYQFVNQIENLIRSTKYNTKIFIIGNMLDTCADILAGLNFIPEEFGHYKLVKNKKVLFKMIKEYKNCKSPGERREIEQRYKDYDFGKRVYIDYMEPTDAYKARRKGTFADIMMPMASTFTNKIAIDKSIVDKSRLTKPLYIIKFDKTPNTWFTVYTNGIVNKYNGEKKETVIAMKPYLDAIYNLDKRNQIIDIFNMRAYRFHTLICFKEFQKQMELIKKQ